MRPADARTSLNVEHTGRKEVKVWKSDPCSNEGGVKNGQPLRAIYRDEITPPPLVVLPTYLSTGAK